MSHETDQEQELRRQFLALRAQEEAFTPLFERTLRGASRRPRGRRWFVPAVGLASAAVVATIWLSVRKPAVAAWGKDSAVDVAAWRSPTDALIRGTDVEWLGTVPSLKPEPAWIVAPSAGDSVNRGTN